MHFLRQQKVFSASKGKEQDVFFFASQKELDPVESCFLQQKFHGFL